MMSDLIIGFASGIANIVIGWLTKESAMLHLSVDYSKISKNPIGTKPGEIEKEQDKLKAGMVKAKNAGIVGFWFGLLICFYFLITLILRVTSKA